MNTINFQISWMQHYSFSLMLKYFKEGGKLLFNARLSQKDLSLNFSLSSLSCVILNKFSQLLSAQSPHLFCFFFLRHFL